MTEYSYFIYIHTLLDYYSTFTQMTALEAKRERARLHERRGRSPSHSFEDLDDDDALEGSFSIEIKPKSDEEEGSFAIDMDGGDDAHGDPDRHLSDMAALAITPIFDYVDQDDSDTEYVEQTEASYSAAAVYSLPSSYQDDRGVLSPASHLMAAQRVATNLQHGHVGSPPTDAQSPPHVQVSVLAAKYPSLALHPLTHLQTAHRHTLFHDCSKGTFRLQDCAVHRFRTSCLPEVPFETKSYD